MHELHHLRLSGAGEERVRRFIGTWEASGKSRQVLTESLVVLSQPPMSCALLDTPKRLRPAVRRLAYLSSGYPVKPALLRKDVNQVIKKADLPLKQQIEAEAAVAVRMHFGRDGQEMEIGSGACKAGKPTGAGLWRFSRDVRVELAGMAMQDAIRKDDEEMKRDGRKRRRSNSI
jgi:hypothetical protein